MRSCSRGQVVDRILASDALLLLEEAAAATGRLHCGVAWEGEGGGIGADGKVEGGGLAPDKLVGGTSRLDDLESMREQKDEEVIVCVSVFVSVLVWERDRALARHTCTREACPHEDACGNSRENLHGGSEEEPRPFSAL